MNQFFLGIILLIFFPIYVDVSVDMPMTLDLGFLRAYGKKPDEELLPEEDTMTPTPAIRSKCSTMLVMTRKNRN